MTDIQKQYETETGKKWMVVPCTHGENGYASWEYQLWLEQKVSQMQLPVILLAGKYWHELTEEEIQSLFDAGVTYGWLLENIKQPDWCEYPDALQGEFGCTSLVLLEYRKKISEEYCKTCDCYRKSK